ncbi:MAG: ABA4-like family protein [Cyclobacteriaceae bacterium]|jgi:hypothetical protein|nr:ABA4-like family protein [Cyclobacteriaceae bacterium]
MDLLFTIANSAAMVGWVLMIFAPRFAATRFLVLSGALMLALAATYITLIVLYFGNSEGNFSSLDGVMQLFQNREAVIAGWIHYLAFDLFVGSWIVSNSRKLGIRHLYVIPCLFFTFMFGPAGLLLYYVVRAAVTKKILQENF